MKYFLLVLLLITAGSCNTIDKSFYELIDFMKLETNENLPREYICNVTDSTLKKIFISEISRQVNDNCWEFEYLFRRKDSIPIQKSIERYYSNNEFELLQASVFELDSNNKPIEIKGEILNGKRMSLNEKNSHFNIAFIFSSGQRIQYSCDLSHQIYFKDSLNSNILILSSKNKILLSNIPSRNDTVLFTTSTRIFEKGKGLIQFSESSGTKAEFYNLKHKNIAATIK